MIAFITYAIVKYENESNNNPQYLHDPSCQLNEAKWRNATSEIGVYADPVDGLFPTAPMLIVFCQLYTCKLNQWSSSIIQTFHSRKCIGKCARFVQGPL